MREQPTVRIYEHQHEKKHHSDFIPNTQQWQYYHSTIQQKLEPQFCAKETKK